MEAYETVRKLPQKGGFGEIYVVRKKADGKGSPTFIMKRARLAKGARLFATAPRALAAPLRALTPRRAACPAG